jgi:two-component system sensor histidine kinase VanS
MSQPRPTDPIGSSGWTERTGGVLTARDCLTLARPRLRGELSIVAGRLAMVLRMHSTEHAGVGLGLAIVNSISQAHDGTLTLTPRTAWGLRVAVELPAAAAA